MGPKVIKPNTPMSNIYFMFSSHDCCRQILSLCLYQTTCITHLWFSTIFSSFVQALCKQHDHLSAFLAQSQQFLCCYPVRPLLCSWHRHHFPSRSSNESRKHVQAGRLLFCGWPFSELNRERNFHVPRKPFPL